MSALLAITGPIYLVVAIGYACVRAGWFAKADLKVLGQFVLRVALPALIFNALASKSFHDILQPQYLVVFTLASVGYGDISPVTPAGRAITIVLALIGIGIFAIPAALQKNLGHAEGLPENN